MKILVVEDDNLLRQGLQQALSHEQYSCDVARSVAEAESLVKVSEYGLILLDLGLPDGDGMTLLKRWRQRGMSQPVLILTARDALDDRVAGLDRGADDYMVKPFALAELLARVRALLRRDQGLASNQLVCGDLCLDLDDKTVTQRGEAVVLTRREFALLRRLMMQVGKVVTRERLQEDIYDWQDDIGPAVSRVAAALGLGAEFDINELIYIASVVAPGALDTAVTGPGSGTGYERMPGYELTPGDLSPDQARAFGWSTWESALGTGIDDAGAPVPKAQLDRSLHAVRELRRTGLPDAVSPGSHSGKQSVESETVRLRTMTLSASRMRRFAPTMRASSPSSCSKSSCS